MCCCPGPSLCFSSLVRVQLLRGHDMLRAALPSPPPGCVSCVAAAIGAGKVRGWLSLLANLQVVVNGSVKKNFLKEKKEVLKGIGATSLNRRVYPSFCSLLVKGRSLT